MMMETWQSEAKATTVQELHNKLSDVATKLSSWERMTFGHVKREMRRLKGELEIMQADPLRQGPTQAELKVAERIMELNYREGLMWKQRARLQWLASGNKNTRFFHIRV